MDERVNMAFRADRGVHVDKGGRVSMWENQAMAFRIKAEDVPEDLARQCYELSDAPESKSQIFVAAILNAAIEAGLVSPPCWIARASNGQLISGTVYPSKEHAENYKWSSDNVEHWKGQTE